MNLKRSIVNKEIENALEIIDYFNFNLPEFAYWGIEEWNNKGSEFDEIRDCMLGWDITDFGSDDFKNIGRVLFTLRNGKVGSRKYPKEYAEKLLIDPENQRAPAHFHRSKREDIICRAGGNIIIELTKADEMGNPSDENFSISIDGQKRTLRPNEIIRLTPGMSLTIPPFTIHQFWGEEGTGYKFDGKQYTISSEISSVCDDWDDNVFMIEFAKRFPQIIEDEPRNYYLCHEYPG